MQQEFSFPEESVILYSAHVLVAPESFLKVCRGRICLNTYSNSFGLLDMNSSKSNRNPFRWFKCLKKQRLELDFCVLQYKNANLQTASHKFFFGS